MKNYLRKILITGGGGQLGQSLNTQSVEYPFSIHACKHDKMDIIDINSIHDAISQISPDVIINTAAYTAVDKAENDIDTAMLVNFNGAKNLAIACEKNNIPLIHISTDYIFDGSKKTPYGENDKASPINLYGKSKWLGEQAVRENCSQHIILRVSGVFSEYGHNFLKTICRLAKEKKVLNIVSDQITCPTYAGNIAKVIFNMISGSLKWGTYHYCDKQSTSWHEFASVIIDKAKQYQPLIVENINAITTAEYPTPAKRPAYSVLDCSKLEKDYGIQQAEWVSSINYIVRKIG